MQCRVAIETVDQPDAVALVGELDAHLEPLYPKESRHGLSLDALRAVRKLPAGSAERLHGKAHRIGGEHGSGTRDTRWP